MEDVAAWESDGGAIGVDGPRHGPCARRCRCLCPECYENGRCICGTCIGNTDFAGWWPGTQFSPSGDTAVFPHPTARGHRLPPMPDAYCAECQFLQPIEMIHTIAEDRWVLVKHQRSFPTAQGAGVRQYCPGSGRDETFYGRQYLAAVAAALTTITAAVVPT